MRRWWPYWAMPWPAYRRKSTSIPARSEFWLSLRCSVEPLVQSLVPQDSLDVLAGFGERDGLDELLRVAVVSLVEPVGDAVGAGVVGGESVFKLSAVFVYHG